MRRRDFIAGLGSAAALPTLWKRVARGQQASIPVVGLLFAGSQHASLLPAFRKGLSQMGVEGRNMVIEYRWADDHYELLPALAADLVGRRVAVIRTGGGAVAARAAMAATATIPIIFHIAEVPLRQLSLRVLIGNGSVAVAQRSACAMNEY